VTDDAERQGLGEHQPRCRVETLGHAEGEGGTAEHPLERPHQVEVADESQVAGLAEPDSDLVQGHRARQPGSAAASGGSASEVREMDWGLQVGDCRFHDNHLIGNCQSAPRVSHIARMTGGRAGGHFGPTLRRHRLLPDVFAYVLGAGS